MTRVAILGATGYSALELIKILLRHPNVEITAVTSRQEGHPPLAMVHPSLAGRLEL
ncbi:MAG TPA: N-acetyl-gamma-glutamyl-phosphate reductase, partial [Pirellulales bacterium]